MKKGLVLSVLIALLTINLYAISYTPEVSVAFGGNFTHYSKEVDSYDNYRSAFNFKSAINPFAVTINDNIHLSLPFSIDYMPHTKAINRLRIQERVRFSLDLKFEYFPAKYFGFSFAPGIGYTYFPKINAGSLFIALTVNPIIPISRHFSISFPTKAIAATGEVEFETSIMCTVYPLGLREKRGENNK